MTVFLASGRAALMLRPSYIYRVAESAVTRCRKAASRARADVSRAVRGLLFAGRWAAKAGLGPSVRQELNLYGPAGRRLHSFDFSKTPFHERTARAPSFDHAQDYDPQVLIASAPDNAVPVLRRLFELFHWDAPDEQLRDAIRKAMTRRL